MSSRKVVVGVDGSSGSRAALEFARKEAGAHNATVHVVQAWEFTPLVVTTDAPLDLDQLREATDEALNDLIREVFGEKGDEVEREVVEDLPHHAILDAATEADLIVVGTRGLGSVRGLFVGSVSQKVVHHAKCPVIVVPEPEPEDEQD